MCCENYFLSQNKFFHYPSYTGAADDSALTQQSITVAASPQVDLAGLYIGRTTGFSPGKGVV